jgi:hypothetical protein
MNSIKRNSAEKQHAAINRKILIKRRKHLTQLNRQSQGTAPTLKMERQQAPSLCQLTYT